MAGRKHRHTCIRLRRVCGKRNRGVNRPRRNGEFVNGTHSISMEILLEYFEIYDRTCRTSGNHEKGLTQ